VPVCTEIGENVDQAGPLIRRQLVERGLIAADTTVVLVSINPDLTKRNANFLKIHRFTSREAS
jgi:hypothetical protein